MLEKVIITELCRSHWLCLEGIIMLDVRSWVRQVHDLLDPCAGHAALSLTLAFQEHGLYILQVEGTKVIL